MKRKFVKIWSWDIENHHNCCKATIWIIFEWIHSLHDNIIVDCGRIIISTWKKWIPFLEKVIIHFVYVQFDPWLQYFPMQQNEHELVLWQKLVLYRQLHFKFRWFRRMKMAINLIEVKYWITMQSQHYQPK
jgi:hypothetical protein